MVTLCKLYLRAIQEIINLELWTKSFPLWTRAAIWETYVSTASFYHILLMFCTSIVKIRSIYSTTFTVIKKEIVFYLGIFSNSICLFQYFIRKDDDMEKREFLDRDDNEFEFTSTCLNFTFPSFSGWFRIRASLRMSLYIFQKSYFIGWCPSFHSSCILP